MALLNSAEFAELAEFSPKRQNFLSKTKPPEPPASEILYEPYFGRTAVFSFTL
jgi:hypothetical protein